VKKLNKERDTEIKNMVDKNTSLLDEKANMIMNLPVMV